MSYYTEDDYVGYDPQEEHDRRIHKEIYHKSEVPTTKELMDTIYTQQFINKSKKSTPKPICDSEDYMERYLSSFEECVYNAIGDLPTTMELILKDKVKNQNTHRIIETNKEHIVRDGTDTYIVYRVDTSNNVLGVFFNKEDAVQFINMKNQDNEQEEEEGEE